jgi:superkiller protein 3
VDSKVSARAIATTEMRNILLREVGEFLQSEQTLREDETSREYSEKTEALTAGIVEMKTLDEQWNGATYYIKAEMTVDPEDVNRRIAEVRNDKQKMQELEASRQRIKAAEAEAARLRKELEESKNEQQRPALQKNYQQATNALSAEEYFTRAYNAQASGFHDLAIEYYQKVVAINPSDAMAYNNMGAAYGDLKNYNEAIWCYQKAIAIDPNHAYAYGNMGNAYDDLKNYNEAIRCYQKAIAIDPNNAYTYNNMGNAYSHLEDYREAIKYYQKAIDLDPNHAYAYGNMGNAYGDLKNYNEAIRYFKKVIDIDPNNNAAYHGIYGMAVRIGRRDRKEAIKLYDILIAHRKSIIDKELLATIYNNKAYGLVELGDSKAALPLVNEALKIHSEKSFIWDTKGEICYHLGLYEQCIQCMDKAISITDSGITSDGGNSYDNSYYYRGLAKIKLGQRISGYQDIKKAAENGKEEAIKYVKEYKY